MLLHEHLNFRLPDGRLTPERARLIRQEWIDAQQAALMSYA